MQSFFAYPHCCSFNILLCYHIRSCELYPLLLGTEVVTGAAINHFKSQGIIECMRTIVGRCRQDIGSFLRIMAVNKGCLVSVSIGKVVCDSLRVAIAQGCPMLYHFSISA